MRLHAFISRMTWWVILALVLALPSRPAAGAHLAAARFTDVFALAAGENHVCALTVGGGVKCWGDNRFGQLGDGSTQMRLAPVDVSGLTSGIVAIASGDNHTCARTSAGAVKCWGRGSYGQLGRGSTVSASTPVSVSGLAGAVELASGGSHNCALLSGGAVKCWGLNASGQLGDGTNNNGLTPVTVTGLNGHTIMALALGDKHTCALTNMNSVLCWGANESGQLGNNSTQNSLTPVLVSGLDGASFLSAGGLHTCTLSALAQAFCWGDNSRGQVGDGSIINRLMPVAVSGLPAGLTSLAGGKYHTCALAGPILNTSSAARHSRSATGTAACWGDNNTGQLGDGSTVISLLPLPVSSPGIVLTSLDAGGTFTCAVTTIGGVKCWGSNWYGQMGDNTAGYRTLAVQSGQLFSGASAITAGGAHTCAVNSAGGVLCWGLGQNGQLGDGSLDSHTLPTAVTGLASGVSNLAAGAAHTCALLNSGAVRCWGENSSGQLGINSIVSQQLTPAAVYGLSSAVKAIAAGSNHTCALISGGAVKCWGANNAGQLGNNTIVSSRVPVDVMLTDAATGISAGVEHTCAVTSYGQVKCWGGNSNGQVGDDTTARRPVPILPVVDVINAVAVSAGDYHACALLNSGGVKCWGWNNYGQLGDNSTNERHTAVDVSGLSSGAAAIAAGDNLSCALLQNGTAKCWGRNSEGQLGNGSLESSPVPVPVSGISAIGALAAGKLEHACALTSAGAVKCWGSNSFGQLGDGMPPLRLTPVNVVGLGGSGYAETYLALISR